VIRLSEYKTKSGGVVSIRDDITELKETERALRDSRDQLRLITDNLPVAIAYIDTDKRFRFVNRTLAEWYARPAEEILGQTYWEALGELASPAAKLRMEAALAGSHQHGERVSSYPDGKTRTIEVSYAPHIDDSGTVLGCVTFNQDITERKRADTSLRQLAAAIESVSDGFALFDTDDRMVLCNSQFKSMNPNLAPKLVPGITFEEMLRDNIAAKRIQDAFDDEEAFVRRRMEEHRNPSGPLVQQREDGRWLELREERTPDGTTLLVNIDITERKRAEDALRESEERFRTLVQHAPEAITMLDVDTGLYLDANPMAEALHGLP
jgi:PAS domain S-box-containing protein